MPYTRVRARILLPDVTPPAGSHPPAPAPWPSPPPPLAEHARTAREPGHCPRCEWLIMPGDRVARLPDGQWCHARCCAKGAT
jgi:hypothetical protein